MPVNFVRRDLSAKFSQWSMIRDCLSGEEAVKAASTTYLPMPGSDRSEVDRARYRQYLQRAVFYSVVRRTLAGLSGQIFLRRPTISVGEDLAPYLDNINGSGVSLVQQSKKALDFVVSYGRCGLLVDYPAVDGVITRQDEINGYVYPTILLYDPFSVINWRERTVGSKRILSLVVIEESYCIEDDGFELSTDTQWRVLRLDDQQNCWSDVWRWDNDDLNTRQLVLTASHAVIDADGNPLHEIPFTFIGSINNDANIDYSPLADLAALNIAHYRNSADYEESCYIAGQPTLYAAGLDQNWVDNVLHGSIALGSRSGLLLPNGATCGLIQAQANSQPFEAMEHKERQMAALGAKLIEQRQVQRTLGEAQIEEAGEVAALTIMAHNVSEAYEAALGMCTLFTGGSREDVEFNLCTDYPALQLSANDRVELVKEWQSGAISYTELRNQLRRIGVATQDDEAAKDEIASSQVGPILDAPSPISGGTPTLGV